MSETKQDKCVNCGSEHNILVKSIYQKLKNKPLTLIHTLKCQDCETSFTVNEII